MANFKRYTMVIRRDENGFATPALKVRKEGEVLKFDEVKELLNSSTNKLQAAIALLKRISNAGRIVDDRWCIPLDVSDELGNFLMDCEQQAAM
jgi:hypothetical protein